jgi:ATP-dependent exoDNAse (exonuclease V) alpha subunit
MSELDEVEIKKDKKVQYKFRYKLKEYDQSITNVFFVDEASMVSDKFAEDDFFIFGSGILLKDLIEFIAPGNLARKDKLIFIGDPAQLSPVGQEHSFALDKKYLFEKYGIKADEYQLKEVVRQAENSGILQNATALRKLIESSGRQLFTIANNDTDIIESEESSMLDNFKLINPNFNIYDGIMLVAKNKTALEHNLNIRAQFFESASNINKGETFLINQNNYNYEVELLNGTLVKVF